MCSIPCLLSSDRRSLGCGGPLCHTVVPSTMWQHQSCGLRCKHKQTFTDYVEVQFLRSLESMPFIKPPLLCMVSVLFQKLLSDRSAPIILALFSWPEVRQLVDFTFLTLSGLPLNKRTSHFQGSGEERERRARASG